MFTKKLLVTLLISLFGTSVLSGVGEVYYCYGHKNVTVKDPERKLKSLDRSEDITEEDTSGNKFTFKWEEKGIRTGEIFYEFVDSLEGDDEKFIAGKNNIDWVQTILFRNNKLTFVNVGWYYVITSFNSCDKYE